MWCFTIGGLVRTRTLLHSLPRDDPERLYLKAGAAVPRRDGAPAGAALNALDINYFLHKVRVLDIVFFRLENLVVGNYYV